MNQEVTIQEVTMTFFVQNYQGELLHDFPMFHSSSTIFKFLVY